MQWTPVLLSEALLAHDVYDTPLNKVFSVSPVASFETWSTASSRTVDYDPFIKSQLASRN